MPTPPVLNELSARTQALRPIAVHTELGLDTLLVRSVKATEGLSRPFEYELDLLSEHPGLHAAKLLGTLATLRISPAGVAPRVVSGYVSAFRRFAPDVSGKLTPYQMTLVPWTFFLTLSRDCRIFQKKTTLDVLADLLTNFKEAHVSEHLTARERYGKRPYCVQYRETAFNFLHRLLEDEGIFYRFEQDADRHRMALCDSLAVSPDAVFVGRLHHRQQFASREPQQQVWNWSHHEEMRPGRYSTTDYDFTRPKMPLDATATTEHPTHPASDIFDYPGGYFEPRTGEDHYAPVRLEELQTARSVFRGETNSPTLAPGFAFQLAGDPLHGTPPPRMVVTEMVFEANNDDLASTGAASKSDRPTYKARFMAVPASEVYRPRRVTARPVVRGAQSATVVGPAGEEIYVDEHARVKVQFHWDRYGQNDENSSCWVRVSQAWAGHGWGGQFIPRIGHEVIVDFFEGDPDRPVITGRIYNGMNKTAHGLPANKTVSTMQSRSSKGGDVDNFNEIKFEDKKGSELFYVQAEKDRQMLVKNNNSETIGNDESLSVGHDRTKTIGNDETTTVGVNRTETVGSNETITIGSNRTESVGANETITIAANRTEQVGANETISIGGNRVLTVAMMEAETVGLAKALTIGAAYQVSVGAAMNETVGGAKLEETGLYRLMVVGGDMKIDIGGDLDHGVGGKHVAKAAEIVLDASKKIIFQCGASSIELTPSLIVIKSPLVKINC